jgi:hypothetical protein
MQNAKLQKRDDPMRAAVTQRHGVGVAETMANASNAMAVQCKLVDMIDGSPRQVLQARMVEGIQSGAQRLAQMKAAASHDETLQRKPQVAVKPNNTGLPDGLKSGIENLSGMAMDHVQVHYNSSQPAQLNALAYAQGSSIYVGPGQERHLPHEAWHLVQQAQGRVRPTMQVNDGVPVNDDKGLEHEADTMGMKAVQMMADPKAGTASNTPSVDRRLSQTQAIQSKANGIIQRYHCAALARLADNGVGRAHNAGIVDEDVTLGTGTQFTQHFHCNGWVEATRNFTSFTGTFDVGGTIHHYTIVDGGPAGWVGAAGAPAAGAFAMRTRTEQKLAALQ